MKMSAIEILVSDNMGIYIPQVFAERFDTDLWSGIDEDDLRTIKRGPDAQYYWDAWCNIRGAAEYKHQGKTWHLHQDGDLFAICTELMADDEYKDFFGEERL